MKATSGLVRGTAPLLRICSPPPLRPASSRSAPPTVESITRRQPFSGPRPRAPSAAEPCATAARPGAEPCARPPASASAPLHQAGSENIARSWPPPLLSKSSGCCFLGQALFVEEREQVAAARQPEGAGAVGAEGGPKGAGYSPLTRTPVSLSPESSGGRTGWANANRHQPQKEGGRLGPKQASRARVASFGCASWHKANLEAAQRTMSQVARDEMACAKRTFGTFPH